MPAEGLFLVDEAGIPLEEENELLDADGERGERGA